MKPTMHLRFVLKGRHLPTEEEVEQAGVTSGCSHSYALHYLTKPGVRMLQQWWTEGTCFDIPDAPDGCVGEWRDVPLETE